RAFAAAEAVGRGEEDDVRRLHVAMRARQAREVPHGIDHGHDDGTLLRLKADRDDLLAALLDAIAIGLADEALDLVRAVAHDWDASGYRRAHELAVEQALELADRVGADPARHVSAL